MPEASVAPNPQQVAHELLDRAITDVYRNSARNWFLRWGYVKDREGIVTTFPNLKLYKVQELMFQHYDECLAARKPVCQIVLKPRKEGASTAAQAMMYHRLRRYPGRQGAVMGDVAGTSDTIFEIFRKFAENDQFNWGDGFGNLKVGDKENNLTDDITLPCGSTYKKVTAGSTNANRSGTIQAANASEVAYYTLNQERDPLTAFLGSWTENSEASLSILDSTSSGPFGRFYEYFMDDRNGYKKIFVPWTLEPSHAIPFASGVEEKDFERSLELDERRIMEEHQLGLPQMRWRRDKLFNKCGGSVEQLNREYPLTIEEAFNQKTALRFSISVLQKIERRAELQKPTTGFILPQQDGTASFTPDPQGDVHVWEQPKVGCKYLLSYDPCSGRDQQSQSREADPDWHSIGVWRAAYMDRTNAQEYPPMLVAHHWSRLEAEVAAQIAAGLSIFYGKCKAVVEINGVGLYAVKKLQELGIPLWQRPRQNNAANMLELAAGWSTTELARKTIIDNLGGLIAKWTPEAPTFEVFSLHAIEQYRKFILDKNGHATAMPGAKDDDVLMTAFGIYNLAAATLMEEPKRPKKDVMKMFRREGWSAAPLVRGFR